MTKETKIGKVLRKLSDMYEFYKKIPKIKGSEKIILLEKNLQIKRRIELTNYFYVFLLVTS